MNLCTTIQRCNPVPAPVGGFFVLNRCGATVAGPFATRQEARAEENRREPAEREARAADIAASRF